jgi:hypothetical protein
MIAFFFTQLLFTFRGYFVTPEGERVDSRDRFLLRARMLFRLTFSGAAFQAFLQGTARVLAVQMAVEAQDQQRREEKAVELAKDAARKASIQKRFGR